MKMYIKNMVSLRCKIMVAALLRELNIQYATVELGYAEILSIPSVTQKQELQYALERIGLELIDNRKVLLCERIKLRILELIQSPHLPKAKYSEVLSEEFALSYRHLSKIFHDFTGINIERYIIVCRIERVKEFLQLYDSGLKEIAYQLNYSSVAHLSGQFKVVTGQCIKDYKASGIHERRCFENLLYA